MSSTIHSRPASYQRKRPRAVAGLLEVMGARRHVNVVLVRFAFDIMIPKPRVHQFQFKRFIARPSQTVEQLARSNLDSAVMPTIRTLPTNINIAASVPEKCGATQTLLMPERIDRIDLARATRRQADS